MDNDITNNGYILLRKVLTDEQLNSGLSCMKNNNKVDYSIMKQFIDNVFLPTIQKNSNIITDPHYVKFRFSNNNNSTDASTFHGDIYNHTDSEVLPIYTCLCYFDDAQLQVIPGSHKYNNLWSVTSFNKKITLNVQRGDIMLFHANMHHRGINYNKSGNRRLLQVFEVFPDKKTYDECSSKLIIVESSKSTVVKNVINPLSYQISKIPWAIDCITFCHYILMYNDLQYKVSLMDVSPWEKTDKYISYEPGKKISISEFLNGTNVEELNVNILCDENIKSVSFGNFYLYSYFYILYWIISIALIILIKKWWFNGEKFTYAKMIKRIFKWFRSF